MKITKQQFVYSLKMVQEQVDKDREQAIKLSEIYGADINPNDNINLINGVLYLLRLFFPVNGGTICEIERFCWEFNFGRHRQSLWKDSDELYNFLIAVNEQDKDNKKINSIIVKQWEEILDIKNCDHAWLYRNKDGTCDYCKKKIVEND